MKKFLIAAFAVLGLSVSTLTVRAADDKKDDKAGGTQTGVLIDNACGTKQKDEAAAAKHPLKCAMKESCEASGYQVVVGDKHLKLDTAGNKLAKTYLASAKSTHVTVTGTVEGEILKVTDIKAAEGGDKAGDKTEKKSEK